MEHAIGRAIECMVFAEVEIVIVWMCARLVHEYAEALVSPARQAIGRMSCLNTVLSCVDIQQAVSLVQCKA